MNVVGPTWGQNIVAYGPGDSRLDHTPDEHIRLDEYAHAIEVLEQVLHMVAGATDEVGREETGRDESRTYNEGTRTYNQEQEREGVSA